MTRISWKCTLNMGSEKNIIYGANVSLLIQALLGGSVVGYLNLMIYKPSTTKKDSTKKESIMLSIQEVEDIVKKLQTQHGSLMKVEQYNAWAHMINTGKHSSYDEPPELPYFKKSKKTCEVQVGADGPDVAKVAVTTLNVRSECISQLEKWHSLYEKKCITEEQYDQLKKSILQDVFNC